MSRLVELLDVSFIPRHEIQTAMQDLRYAQLAIADQVEPTCLIPASQELSGDSRQHYKPVDCKGDASPNNHSIQEHGVLSLIASPHHDGSLRVLKFFPSVGQIANQTKANGQIGAEWFWNIDPTKPCPIPISEASVGHFACRDDDLRVFAPLERGLRVSVGKSGSVIQEPNHQLLLLAYRTLLSRISQLRGIECESTSRRKRQVLLGNRFGVEVLDKSLGEISTIVRRLYSYKQMFDRSLTGFEDVQLIHHLHELDLPIAIAASEMIPMGPPYRPHDKKQQAQQMYASVNIYPFPNRTLLVLSYPKSEEGKVDRGFVS